MASLTENRPASRGYGARGVLFAFLAIVLLITGFGGGVITMWFVGPQVRQAAEAFFPTLRAQTEKQQVFEERIDILRQAWAILDREFIAPEKLDPDKMIHGAAAGMVSALGDPHTMFVEPVSAAIMDEDMQGSFEGIGATVEMVEGKLTIVRPLPNSPAYHAGLLAGDIILAVDDEPLEGKTLMEAIRLIRGPAGTVVRLLVQREGVAEPFLVSVTRAKVELPNYEAKMLEGQVAYLQLSEFNALAPQQVHSALRDLLAQKPVGLILDLRDNPGGYLHAAVQVASEFLPLNTVILQEAQRGQPIQVYRVRTKGLATEIPLVVLVNGGSASASEIVAGAIQEAKRGTLIGTKTYGKGSVQNTHTLNDGSSLRVTIAKWLLPSGRGLDGDGLVPDIEVPFTLDDAAAHRDPQLERAVALLLHQE